MSVFGHADDDSGNIETLGYAFDKTGYVRPPLRMSPRVVLSVFSCIVGLVFCAVFYLQEPETPVTEELPT